MATKLIQVIIGDFSPSDFDECAANTDDCHTDAICKNDPGSFSCGCMDGYVGDGRSCEGK